MVRAARTRRVTAPRQLWIAALGQRPYREVLDLQRELARARISGELAQDVLLLVEHPPVITLGRSAKERHLILSRAALAARGIELHEVERGGDVTFHGPGQLVGYPIVDLRRHKQDLHWYLRQLEEAVIRAVGQYGIAGERNPSYTGVWTAGRKLASIGVHARDWVTWHGFALNVTTDLSFFDLIVPCGIRGVVMTSIARELGAEEVSAQDVKDRVTAKFADAFDLTAVVTSRAALLETVA
jgi:lipoate-protein ligase B